MTTGYDQNKGGREEEAAKVARMKTEQSRIKKQHLQTDIDIKKKFLFSTKTTIDMKKAVLQGKVLKEQEVKRKITILKEKVKGILARIRGEVESAENIEREEKVKESALGIAEQSSVRTKAEEQAIQKRALEIDTEISQKKKAEDQVESNIHADEAEIARLNQALETKKKELAQLKEDHKRRVAALANLSTEKSDLTRKKNSLNTKNSERQNADKKRDVERLKQTVANKKSEKARLIAEEHRVELEIDKEQKQDEELINEENTFKREIDQLDKDRAVLEAEIRKLESELRAA